MGNDRLGVYKIYMVRMSNLTDEPLNVRLLMLDAMKIVDLLSKVLVWFSMYCVAEKPMDVTGVH